MKVVFIKNNNSIKYLNCNIDGYKFKPRRKNISSLTIINNDMIKYIINKKLSKDIFKIDKTVKLIVKSDMCIISDCEMMIDEVKKIINLIRDKYLIYINEFEFFDYIKSMYILNKILEFKKKVLVSNE